MDFRGFLAMEKSLFPKAGSKFFLPSQFLKLSAVAGQGNPERDDPRFLPPAKNSTINNRLNVLFSTVIILQQAFTSALKT